MTTNLRSVRPLAGLLAMLSIGHAAAGDCSAVPQWSTRAYAPGEQVAHAGRHYQCREAPYHLWCGTGGAYEPGVGWAWTQRRQSAGRSNGISAWGTSVTGSGSGTSTPGTAAFPG